MQLSQSIGLIGANKKASSWFGFDQVFGKVGLDLLKFSSKVGLDLIKISLIFGLDLNIIMYLCH